jgi:hypothetical protein
MSLILFVPTPSAFASSLSALAPTGPSPTEVT